MFCIRSPTTQLAITYPQKLAITWPFPNYNTVAYVPTLFTLEQLQQLYEERGFDISKFDDIDYVGRCYSSLDVFDHIDFSLCVSFIRKQHSWLMKETNSESSETDSKSECYSDNDFYDSGSEDYDLETYEVDERNAELEAEETRKQREKALEARKSSRMEFALSRKCSLHRKLADRDNKDCKSCAELVARVTNSYDPNFVLFSDIGSLEKLELEYFIEQSERFIAYLREMLQGTAHEISWQQFVLDPDIRQLFFNKLTRESRYLLNLLLELDAGAKLALDAY